MKHNRSPIVKENESNVNAQDWPSGQATPQGQAQGVGPNHNILGLQTAELAGLSVDEITGNKVAITMVMHYYKRLVDENALLRNDMNTAQTYVSGYAAKKTNTTVGAALQALASLGIGFGINLLTNDASRAPGWVTLVLGVLLQGVGMYFALKDKA